MFQKYISQHSFEIPKVFVPTSAYGHAPFFFWLFNALSPRCAVELGSANGYTFFVFCQAVSLNNASVYAIDTWRGDINTGLYGEEIYQSVCLNLKTHFTEVDAHLVRSTFDKAAPDFPDSSVDLLFIDGCHTYDAVKSDYETWRSKMSDRGVMVFHDTAVIAENFGVHQFWKEITQAIPGFEFNHDHGLGVLPVGANVPGIIHSLVREDEQTKKELQAVYSCLGERLTLKSQLAFAEKNIAKRDARIDSLLGSLSWKITAPLRLINFTSNAIKFSKK